MNTRRSRRSIPTKDEEKQDTEIQKRKRRQCKIDSSDDGSSLDFNPAENVMDRGKKDHDSSVKSITKERKRNKFDKDNFSDDEDEQNTSNSSLNRKRKIPNVDDGSSSDSSVGDYLKTAEEIDLSSSFFTLDNNDKQPDFDAIEKKMFSGIQRLSDSEESEYEDENLPTSNPEIKTETSNSQNAVSSTNFSQIRNFNKKLEEAKACVKKYERKKESKIRTKVENNVDITQLLSVGETKNRNSIDSLQNDLDSDDELDWEEIEENIDKPEETLKIPEEGVQITVELPSTIRKKSKGVDLMAAIKRRINRIKKENQVYVHKVHLLCWIAHGNFLNNSVLNNETLLGKALSLLPSEQCYPPKHADMKYLEQIARWYGKMMKLAESPIDNQTAIKEQLSQQISKRQASNKRNFVFLFIIILRSLGLQCRLVLSFQCLPLRPSNSELCSLSTKESKSTKSENEKATTSKKSNSKNQSKSSKSKPVTVNTSIKNKLNKTLNDSIKNKLNQSLNQSMSKAHGSLITNETNKSISNTKKTKSSKKLSIKEKLDKNSKDDSKLPIKKINKEVKLKDTVKVESNDTKKVTPSTSKSKSSKKLSLKEKLDKNLEKSPIKISQVDGADDSPPSKSKTKTSKKASLSSKINKNYEELDSDFRTSQKPVREARRKPVKYVETESTESDLQSSQGTSSTKSPVKDINHNKKSNATSKIEVKSRAEKPSTSATKSKLDVRDDIINLLKDHMTEKRNLDKSKTVRKASFNSDYDSDFVPEPVIRKSRQKNKLNSSSEFAKKITVNTKVKRRVKPRSEIDRRALSSDDEDSQDDPNKKKKIGTDIWVEVFLEEEEKWISVDLLKGQVHCITELYNRASHPVSYIVAWNNNLSLKDITARYCPNWNTVTRKLRVDSSWWNQALRPFIGVKTARDKEEDEDLARQQLDKPLPTTISEYKNHPLYALKRHLLKFEAIYPPDALTLGFVRNEAVYARECVHTLHSREIWVKHAKVVKPGQQPYKIVKARPKYDKLTGNVITDLPLELFGNWQIEDYVPPTAENGIVPRNAFGNVELFKMCMLPKKTVHLQLPGLNKVARKLRIDCAPAVVGFDFHAGGSHPTFDGYVVCEEFKDVLIAAWEEDREQTAKKELEKYEKRVYGNWRKLIKGLLIRERLKARYDFGNPSTSGEKSKKKTKHSKPKKPKIDSEEEPEDY